MMALMPSIAIGWVFSLFWLVWTSCCHHCLSMKRVLSAHWTPCKGNSPNRVDIIALWRWYWGKPHDLVFDYNTGMPYWFFSHYDDLFLDWNENVGEFWKMERKGGLWLLDGYEVHEDLWYLCNIQVHDERMNIWNSKVACHPNNHWRSLKVQCCFVRSKVL